MNKQQRKEISDMLDVIEGIISTFEEMAEEEQEKFNNMPESLQDTDRGEALQESSDNLQASAYDLQDWLDNVRDYFEL